MYLALVLFLSSWSHERCYVISTPPSRYNGRSHTHSAELTMMSSHRLWAEWLNVPESLRSCAPLLPSHRLPYLCCYCSTQTELLAISVALGQVLDRRTNAIIIPDSMSALKALTSQSSPFLTLIQQMRQILLQKKAVYTLHLDTITCRHPG